MDGNAAKVAKKLSRSVVAALCEMANGGKLKTIGHDQWRIVISQGFSIVTKRQTVDVLAKHCLMQQEGAYYVLSDFGTAVLAARGTIEAEQRAALKEQEEGQR